LAHIYQYSKNKIITTPNVSSNAEKGDHTYIAGGNKNDMATLGNSLAVSSKTKHTTTL
jgi:hypothetical protein